MDGREAELTEEQAREAMELAARVMRRLRGDSDRLPTPPRSEPPRR